MRQLVAPHSAFPQPRRRAVACLAAALSSWMVLTTFPAFAAEADTGAVTLTHVVGGQLIELTVPAPGPVASRPVLLQFTTKPVLHDRLPLDQCEATVLVSRVRANEPALEKRPQLDAARNAFELQHTFPAPGQYLVSLRLKHRDQVLNANFPLVVSRNRPGLAPVSAASGVRPVTVVPSGRRPVLQPPSLVLRRPTGAGQTRAATEPSLSVAAPPAGAATSPTTPSPSAPETAGRSVSHAEAPPAAQSTRGALRLMIIDPGEQPAAAVAVSSAPTAAAPGLALRKPGRSPALVGGTASTLTAAGGELAVAAPTTPAVSSPAGATPTATSPVPRVRRPAALLLPNAVHLLMSPAHPAPSGSVVLSCHRAQPAPLAPSPQSRFTAADRAALLPTASASAPGDLAAFEPPIRIALAAPARGALPTAPAATRRSLPAQPVRRATEVPSLTLPAVPVTPPGTTPPSTPPETTPPRRPPTPSATHPANPPATSPRNVASPHPPTSLSDTPPLLSAAHPTALGTAAAAPPVTPPQPHAPAARVRAATGLAVTTAGAAPLPTGEALLRAALRSAPQPLRAGRRALLEVYLTEAVASSQGLMCSVPVEASQLRATVSTSGAAEPLLVDRPLARRDRVGLYALRLWLPTAGDYQLHLTGARPDGQALELTLGLSVAE